MFRARSLKDQVHDQGPFFVELKRILSADNLHVPVLQKDERIEHAIKMYVTSTKMPTGVKKTYAEVLRHLPQVHTHAFKPLVLAEFFDRCDQAAFVDTPENIFNHVKKAMGRSLVREFQKFDAGTNPVGMTEECFNYVCEKLATRGVESVLENDQLTYAVVDEMFPGSEFDFMRRGRQEYESQLTLEFKDRGSLLLLGETTNNAYKLRFAEEKKIKAEKAAVELLKLETQSRNEALANAKIMQCARCDSIAVGSEFTFESLFFFF